MSINIPSTILNFPGQCVKQIKHNLTNNTVQVICRRDKRYAAKDPTTHKRGAVNLYASGGAVSNPMLFEFYR